MRFRLFPFLCSILPAVVLGEVARSQTSRQPQIVFRQDADDLSEVSGIAVVRSQPSLFWMHNDSGDTPRLFVVNKQGKIALTVTLDEAAAFDWEDVDAQGQWVYVSDTGDNFSIRRDVQIYRFKTPSIAATALGRELTLSESQWERTILRFPDGPHDCESLVTTPDGRVLLVTKSTSGVSTFYIWNKAWKNGASGTLTKVGAWRFGREGKRDGLATGADFSPNGRKLVVTTPVELHEFALRRAFDFSSLEFKPQTQKLPDEKQCEAVCYSLDGRTIYSTGEGEHAPVFAFASKLK